MRTGYSGTFVISWAQTELDGLTASALGHVEVGATWRWSGRATRIDDQRDILMLGISGDAQELRKRAAAQVRRLFGELIADTQNGAGDPDEDDDLEEPLFKAGFDLTDGRKRYRATVIRLELSHHPIVLFAGDLPPADQDLWVVSHNLAASLTAAPNDSDGVICFVSGTQVRTSRGMVAVDALCEGDLIATKDNGMQPVRWTGQRRISAARMMAMPHLRPVHIRSHFFADGHPEPDLFVSPEHRLLLQGPAADALFNTPEVMVAARDLINDVSVTLAHQCKGVTYHHILLDDHQVVWANGVECESFHPARANLASMDPVQLHQLRTVLPEVTTAPQDYGMPVRRELSQAEAALFFHDIGPRNVAAGHG